MEKKENLINEDLKFLNDFNINENILNILKIKNEIIQTLEQKVEMIYFKNEKINEEKQKQYEQINNSLKMDKINLEKEIEKLNILITSKDYLIYRFDIQTKKQIDELDKLKELNKKLEHQNYKLHHILRDNKIIC